MKLQRNKPCSFCRSDYRRGLLTTIGDEIHSCLLPNFSVVAEGPFLAVSAYTRTGELVFRS
jgi:hypothetical protein